MKKNIKIVISFIGVIAYAALLFFIGSKQSYYDVTITTQAQEYEFSAEKQDDYIISVDIKNDANRLLNSKEGNDFFLSYHLYDSEGNLISYDNVRSSFDKSIFSHSKGKVDLHIEPLERGEYIVGIDLVNENVVWFSDNGMVEYKIKITIK